MFIFCRFDVNKKVFENQLRDFYYKLYIQN